MISARTAPGNASGIDDMMMRVVRYSPELYKHGEEYRNQADAQCKKHPGESLNLVGSFSSVVDPVARREFAAHPFEVEPL